MADHVPVRVPGAAESWSSDWALALPGRVPCYDVNGYYRDLGIPWPYTHATGRMIRQAYLAASGPNSARLTYVFTQLLDPARKARYDAMPLGEVFMDRYVQEHLRRCSLASESGRAQIGSWVMQHDPGATEPLSGSLDNDLPQEQDGAHPAGEQGEDEYPYSVFVLGTAYYDRRTLARWQMYLLRAFRDHGVRIQVSLGMMEGESSTWMAGDYRDSTLILLDRGLVPGTFYAEQIARTLAVGHRQ